MNLSCKYCTVPSQQTIYKRFIRVGDKPNDGCPHPSRGGQIRLVLYHAKVYDSERYMTHFT